MPGIKAPRIGQSGWAGDALVALSVSNLVLFLNWLELIYTDGYSANAYFLPDYTWRSYLAAILALLLLTAVFLLALRLYRNAQGAAARSVLPLVALAYSLFLVNATRIIYVCDTSECLVMRDISLWLEGHMAQAAVAAVAILSLVFMIRKALPWVAGCAYIGALIFSPFALLNVFYASVHIARSAASPVPAADMPAAGRSRTGTSDGAKTVFLLFDALDAAAFYDDVNAGARFEHFERLEKQSIVFENVRAMRTFTMQAIPLLTTGQDVEVAHYPDGSGYRWRFSDSDLLLQDSAGEASSWSESEHVFRMIGNAGQSIAILGFYHPYCRLFGAWADYCKSFSYGRVENGLSRNILESLRAQLGGLHPFHIFRTHTDTYLRMEKSALEVLSDNSMDFYWLHMPVPHQPWIYDAERKRFRAQAMYGVTDKPRYLGNVQLADRFLGKVVAQLKQEGIWDDSTLIVTSDHPGERWLAEDSFYSHRVPLLIKLPQQRRGYRFENWVLQTQIKPIIEWIAVRKNRDPEELTTWLKAQDSAVPVRGAPAMEEG